MHRSGGVAARAAGGIGARRPRGHRAGGARRSSASRAPPRPRRAAPRGATRRPRRRACPRPRRSRRAPRRARPRGAPARGARRGRGAPPPGAGESRAAAAARASSRSAFMASRSAGPLQPRAGPPGPASPRGRAPSRRGGRGRARPRFPGATARASPRRARAARGHSFAQRRAGRVALRRDEASRSWGLGRQPRHGAPRRRERRGIPIQSLDLGGGGGVWGARAALPPVAGVRTDLSEAPAFGVSTFRAIDSLPVFLGLPQRRARARS